MKHSRLFFFPFVVLLGIVLVLPAPAGAGDTNGLARSFSLAKDSKDKPAGDQAPGAPVGKAKDVRFIGYFDLGVATLKADSADLIQTGRTGPMFTLGAGLSFFSVFDVGAGFGLVFLKDHNPFTNLTTGGERKSSVTPLIYFLQAGIQVPIPAKNANGEYSVWLGAHVGAMGVSADRSIPMCVDCDTEDVKLSSGSFIRPEFKIRIDRHAYLGVAYWLFCDKCDFQNMITLSFSGTFAGD